MLEFFLIFLSTLYAIVYGIARARRDLWSDSLTPTFEYWVIEIQLNTFRTKRVLFANPFDD